MVTKRLRRPRRRTQESTTTLFPSITTTEQPYLSGSPLDPAWLAAQPAEQQQPGGQP